MVSLTLHVVSHTLGSELIVHKLLGEVIVNRFREVVTLVIAVPGLWLHWNTDQRVVVLEFNDLIRFVGVEKVENVDVSEDISSDDVEGRQGDGEAAFLDVTRNSLFATVNHRSPRSFDGTCSGTRPLPGPKNELVSFLMPDRHRFAQTNDALAKVRVNIENRRRV